MEDDRPTAGRGEQDGDEEDALPDWRSFAKFAKSNAKGEERVVLVPFIPKRGEKDFQPISAPSSSLPQSSNQATLSQYQINTLQESRTALFSALSSGSRHHSSKGHNSFTWRPELDGGRATCDNDSVYGIHFHNLGRHHLERKRMELLPEEALYLVERGVIELWREGETQGEGEDAKVARVPMSVQQAWAELIGHDGLTIERFQVFAYLKRLGYVLVRARSTTPTPTTPPLALSTRLYRLLCLPFSQLHSLAVALARSLRLVDVPKRLQLTVTRALKAHEGRIASLVSGRRWSTYDQIFSRLQIIPTGHDAPLPRAPTPHTPSVLAPLQPVPPTPTTASLPNMEEHPYETFFNIYKPVTKFRKSAPPPPDFRVVIVNATTTPMPDLFEFDTMFSTVPFDPTEDYLLPPPRVARTNLPPPTPRPRRGPPPSSKTTPPTLFHRIKTLLGLVPAPKAKGPSPYPRLKLGRRSILVAVVDNGTISMLRFSETEFGKLSWSGGVGRSA